VPNQHVMHVKELPQKAFVKIVLIIIELSMTNLHVRCESAPLIWSR